MKKKVLFVYDNLLHYRVPLFNLLGECYDFTVIHSGKPLNNDVNSFNELVYKSYKLGPFLLRPNIYKEIYSKKYDIILYNFDLRWILELFSLIFPPRKTKLILWGAWITKFNLANKIRLFFLKRHNSLFYCHKSRMDFVNKGLDIKKTWVANNTIKIEQRVESYKHDKSIILFVGTLNFRKQNNVLLQAFSNIVKDIPGHISLVFIGEGCEINELKNLRRELKLEDRVNFTGQINDTNQLSNYYKKSIINVSFGQAGLSILQSFGFGVPYLTKYNAVSGGEITNIKHEFNGLLCNDNQESLEINLIKMINNINFAKQLGKNAYQYYTDYCTINNMSQGFIDSIEDKRKSVIDNNI